MVRDTGTRASQLLGVKDDVVAFDFDRAISLRMLRHDNEREDDHRKFLMRFFVKLLTGEELNED